MFDLSISCRTLRGLLAVAFLISVVRTSLNAQKTPSEHLTVVLDPSSFSLNQIAVFQPTVNRVAAIVDELIPGRYLGESSAGIICFLEPAWWRQQLPMTIWNEPVTLGEPTYLKAGDVRIAVSGVSPFFYQKLAYQLAHELAHVKMGAGQDDYLNETFAVAVSLEVERRLGPTYEEYRISNIDLYTKDLPSQVRQELRERQWPQLVQYWQGEIPKQTGANTSWDYDFATLGALILESQHQPEWAKMLGEGHATKECVLAQNAVSFLICQPDLARLTALQPALDALGYIR